MYQKMKTYFDLPWIAGLILHIFFGWIFSCVSRFLRGKFISAILALPFLLGFVFWVVDLVSIIINKEIEWLDF